MYAGDVLSGWLVTRKMRLCTVYTISSIHTNYRFSLAFFDASQTLYMCPAKQQSMSLINEYPLLYIDVFTSSEESLQYSLMIEPVEDFVLE